MPVVKKNSKMHRSKKVKFHCHWNWQFLVYRRTSIWITNNMVNGWRWQAISHWGVWPSQTSTPSFQPFTFCEYIICFLSIFHFVKKKWIECGTPTHIPLHSLEIGNNVTSFSIHLWQYDLSKSFRVCICMCMPASNILMLIWTLIFSTFICNNNGMWNHLYYSYTQCAYTYTHWCNNYQFTGYLSHACRSVSQMSVIIVYRKYDIKN